MRNPIALCFIAIILMQAAFAEETAILDQAQLNAVATKVGCTPMNEKSYGVMPWAIDGYRDFKDVRQAITVFWCAKNSTEFLLVFEASGELMNGECPPYIHWDVHPRGLRLNYKPQPLSSFDGNRFKKKLE